MSELLTEQQAADRLHMGERTLRDLRRRGLIRYVALTARKIAYRPEDCDEYVASRLRLSQPVPDPLPRQRRKKTGSPAAQGVIVPFSQRKKVSG